MSWRITQTTDNQHIGTVLEHVEVGQIITFYDGDAVPVDKIFAADEGNTLLICSSNYQMTLTKE